LRYHGSVFNLNTLSDDDLVRQDLQSFQLFTVYEDINQISNGLDAQIINFDDHRKVTHEGFQELLTLSAQTRQEFSSELANTLKQEISLQASEQEERLYKVLESETNHITQMV